MVVKRVQKGKSVPRGMDYLGRCIRRVQVRKCSDRRDELSGLVKAWLDWLDVMQCTHYTRYVCMCMPP